MSAAVAALCWACTAVRAAACPCNSACPPLSATNPTPPPAALPWLASIRAGTREGSRSRDTADASSAATPAVSSRPAGSRGQPPSGHTARRAAAAQQGAGQGRGCPAAGKEEAAERAGARGGGNGRRLSTERAHDWECLPRAGLLALAVPPSLCFARPLLRIPHAALYCFCTPLFVPTSCPALLPCSLPRSFVHMPAQLSRI